MLNKLMCMLVLFARLRESMQPVDSLVIVHRLAFQSVTKGGRAISRLVTKGDRKDLQAHWDKP